MSLYSFAEANLTTVADRKRRPAVTQGQVARTLILAVVTAAGLVGVATHQPSHAHSAAMPKMQPLAAEEPAQS